MEIILLLPILLFSAIVHEVSHGYVADKLGDPTARLSGRLTLNPKNHIDPFMSILVPLMLIFSGSPIIFGAAKPVPIDPFNLKEGRKDIALVSLAGPLANILLAIFFSLIVKLISLPFIENFISPFLFTICYLLFVMIVKINLLLAIFNLLPIPPLDGSKIFSLILPEKEAMVFMSLDQIGFLILLFFLFFPIGGFSLTALINQLLLFSQSLLLP